MSGPQRTPYRTILDQLDAAHRFANLHDWVEIAPTPEDARRIIRQGKLALVLTLEAEFPFCRQEPCGTGPDETDHAAIRATLDEYQDRGLAAFQVVAHFDNPYAGLAVFSQAMHTLQWFHDELLRDGEVNLAEISAAMTQPGSITGQAVRRILREAGSNLSGQILTSFHSLEELNDFHALLGIMGGVSGPRCEPRGGGSSIHCGRCLDAKNPIACENVLGLTPLGRWLVGELMSRQMLIDVAHMSERGIREVVAMARDHQPAPYPVYVSHGNPRSALVAGAFKGPHMEKPSSDEMLELIAATGGMFGQRTGADAMISSGINDCQGSSKAFAEALKYLVDFSETNSDPLPVGFALDMNGMTHQAVPRFVDPTDARTERRSGRAACLGNAIAQGIQRRPVSDHPATPFTDETDLNRKGLGHVGLLGAFVDDLHNVGLDQKYLDALDSSAEAFLLMWERSR